MNYIKTKITIVILSFLSFLVSGVITLEKIELLKNPQHVPSCSINPFISCGPIMESWQASLFGIPNPIIGLVGFALLGFIAFLTIFVKLPHWLLYATLVGVVLSHVFIIWLISQSLFVIHALCVYCIAVWFMNIFILWFTVNLVAKETNNPKIQKIAEFKIAAIVLSIIIVLTLIFLAFMDNWLLLLQ